jgi:lipopolysaccharide biosynthesis glycosyltransferase
MSGYAVVTCSDINMLPAACCALLSIARHNAAPATHYYLIGIDLTAEDVERVGLFGRQNGIIIEIIPYSAPDTLRATMGRWSNATLARLFMDGLLPADIDRLLYVDADVLVDAPIDPLWSLDLGGKLLGAVDDYLMAFPEKANRREKQLGLSHGPDYFNAGVLLFDWQGCLAENVLAETRDLLSDTSRTFDANDQDVLNIVFQGRWLPLEHRWNVQTGLSPFVEQPTILHFTGRRKPWQTRRNWAHRAFVQFYQDVLTRTPWQDFCARRSFARDLGDFVRYFRKRIGNLPREARARSYFKQRIKAVSLARSGLS